MIRTGNQYRDSVRDGRAVWINGERVRDVTAHPAFRPVVDIRARIYDMAHDPATRERMSYEEEGERYAIGLKLPFAKADWQAKRDAVDLVTRDIGGIVTRVGDETIGEMWSLWDGSDILNEIDPRFAENIARHIRLAIASDPFHVSANTDPKGDRSKRPQDQDPDMLVHVVRETDAGIVIRGAKYETAAAYANQAFLKPTIANWGDAKLSDYALGCILRMDAPGVKHICRTGFAGRAPARDYPLSNRFDEIDTLVILDNVLIPWEDVLFYRHTRAAAFIRQTLHRYSAFPFVQRTLSFADLLIGAALWNAAPDRPRQAAGGPGEARRACRLARGHQCPSDGRHRAGRDQPARPRHAQPVAAVHRPRPRHDRTGRAMSYRPRTVRRADLRHP